MSKVEKLGPEMHSFHISVFLDFVSKLEKCKELSKKKKLPGKRNTKLNPLAVLFKAKKDKTPSHISLDP